MYEEIASHLSEHDLLISSTTNKLFHNIYKKYVDGVKFDADCFTSCYLGEYGVNNRILSIKKIIDALPENRYFDWNDGLFCACKYGHLTLAKLMIRHGANCLNLGMEVACKYDHVSLIQLMIKHGATYCCNCDRHPKDHN
jgi:ankyrin repeat protein